MDLAQHAAVLWRFRAVVAGGLLLGIVLALLAAYQVGWDGGPSITKRGSETWTTTSSLLVTQPGFPEGRITFPTGPRVESPGTTPETTGSNRSTGRGGLEFADPSRFSALANFYAELALSDRVRSRLPERPKPGQIEARPVEGASGQPILPVIELVTFAESSEEARSLNKHLVASLQGVLTSGQAQNDIPQSQRVQLALLNRPSAPEMISGPSNTASILALLLSVIGAIALAHVLAALRDRQDAEAVDGVVVPWTIGQSDPPQPEAATEPAPMGVAGDEGWADRWRSLGGRQQR
jgi:hypothetical protein